MQTRHVVIIGAGPAGLCLSLALAQQGMQVDVIERQGADALAEPGFDGREIALTHASMRLLRTL
ncbi:MAG: FAD-dependent oxidoreductase, partial [Dokdonella sp.]